MAQDYIQAYQGRLVVDPARLLALIAIAEAAQGLIRPLIDNVDRREKDYQNAADQTLHAVVAAMRVP